MLQIKMLKNSKFKTYKLILVLVPNVDTRFWWLLAGCKQVAQALDVSARLHKVIFFQI